MSGLSFKLRIFSSLFLPVSLLLCLGGCLESRVSVTAGRVKNTDKAAEMLAHLKRQNLPALESVRPWHNEFAPGVTLVTRHYEVHTTLLEPLMLCRLPGFMESAYRAYNRQFPRPIETRTRFTIYLFADRRQWEDFTAKFAGPQAKMYRKIKAGAYYLNGACVAYNIGRERTFAVLGHEGWHQFNGRHFKFRLPSWLDEGIAMLFEANSYRQGMFYFEPGKNLYRLGDLRETLLKDRMIPLNNLIAMNPGEALTIEKTGAVKAFYSQAYALVRFLREEGYGKRLSNYHQLLMDGLTGNWPLSSAEKMIAANRSIPLTVRWNRLVGTKLFEIYIDDDIEQIEEEYKRFCRKIVYHVRLK